MFVGVVTMRVCSKRVMGVATERVMGVATERAMGVVSTLMRII